MRNLVVILAVVALFMGWKIHRSRTERLALAAANAEVILYATDWCGYCRMTREYLADNKIAFVEYDIEKSDEGRRQYEALGVRGVPVLNVNGTIVEGHDPRGIRAALE